MFQRTKICTGLLLAFGGLLSSAYAQDASVQRVEITGSSIKRVDAETALPVQVVTREDINKLGVTTTESLLQHITANSAVGGTNAAENAGAATYGISSASLRGLGEARTLVLVNGHRLANYATDGTAVDVNSIPLAAVERVEVLKDGASGLYGSDAIAGVINFILRQDFNGVELNAYYGQPTQSGGGKSSKASIVVGFGNYQTDHFNAMVSLDAGKDSAIYGRQRGYASTSWNDNGLREQSATPSGALTSYLPGANPGDPLLGGIGLGNPLAVGGAAGNNCTANGSNFDANAATCRFNSSPFVPLTPDVTRLNVSGNLRTRIDEQNSFFVEGFVSHQKSVVTEQFSPFSNSFLSTDALFQKAGVNPSIVLNPTNPNYPLAYLRAVDASHANDVDDDGNPVPWSPVAGKAVSVSYRSFDAGQRVHTDTSTLYHLTTGFEGSLKGFDYNLNYSHNTSNVAETTQQGYESQLALTELLSGNDAFNPFTQYQSPALAAQIRATNYNGPMINNTLSTDSIDAKATHDIYQLPGGPLVAAVGVTFRKEKLVQNPSLAYQSGDIAGYGGDILPVDASRNSHSVFVEVDAPVLKSLDLDVSVRNDHYPNATTTNPKFTLRFQPIQQVVLRGSYGRGFREPSLPELYDQQTIGVSNSFVDPAHKGDPSSQYPVTAGGNPDLKPEKSKQFSLGAVLQPAKNLSATIDFWHIKVDDEVTTLDPEFIVNSVFNNVGNYGALLVRSSPATGSVIQNIIATNINVGGVMTSGVDVDINWKSDPSAAGVFGVSLNGTYTHKYDLTLPDGTVQHSVGNTIDPGGNNLIAVTGPSGGVIFKWRHELTGSWTYGPYGLSVSQNYQTKYNDAARADCDGASCAVPNKVKSLATYDLQGEFTGVKNATFRLGLKNIFDKKPPEVVTAGQYFQTGYDPTYFDPHGRFVYGSATYKF